MIELPGSFSGIEISPIPQRGQRPASGHHWQFSSVTQPTLQRAVRLNQGITGRQRFKFVRAVTNGAQVMTASSSATRRATPDGYLVQYPPLYRQEPVPLMRQAVFDMFQIMLEHRYPAEISCPSVNGVASCKWVRPILRYQQIRGIFHSASGSGF